MPRERRKRFLFAILKVIVEGVANNSYAFIKKKVGGYFEVGVLVSYLLGVHFAIVQGCTAGPLQLNHHVARVSHLIL